MGTSEPHRPHSLPSPARGQALHRRANTIVMKLSPKQKGLKVQRTVSPTEINITTLQRNSRIKGSPWKSVVIGRDGSLARSGWWEGHAHGPGPRKVWLSPLPPPPLPSLRKFNFLFWVLCPDGIHHSWRGHRKLHLISSCLGFLLLCA